MTRRNHPTVLEHLAIGGLRPEILEEFRNRHRPCQCASCTTAEEAGPLNRRRPPRRCPRCGTWCHGQTCPTCQPKEKK